MTQDSSVKTADISKNTAKKPFSARQCFTTAGRTS